MLCNCTLNIWPLERSQNAFWSKTFPSFVKCVKHHRLISLGLEDKLSGAQPERPGGRDTDAEVKRSSQYRGERGGDETDGGLSQPLQVHEE